MDKAEAKFDTGLNRHREAVELMTMSKIRYGKHSLFRLGQVRKKNKDFVEKTNGSLGDL